MDRGWSLKTLHRLIVDVGDLPAVVAASRRNCYARDPVQPPAGARAAVPRRAEIVRDIALAASGLLNAKVGGPSVIPPAPAFLFQPPASYGPKAWNEATGAGPLPPRALHVPLPLGAVPDAADLRRAQRRHLLRPPRALEHAAAGADDAERADVPRIGAGAGDARP